MLNDKIKKDLLDLYKISEKEVSKIYKKSEAKIKEYTKKNPNEVKKTILGGGLGAGLATLFGYTGSIGVVGYGLGLGIPVALLALIGGAVVGNRLGIGKDLENKRNYLLVLYKVQKHFSPGGPNIVLPLQRGDARYHN